MSTSSILRPAILAASVAAGVFVLAGCYGPRGSWYPY